MPTFKFEAMDTCGGEVKDTVEAQNEEEAQQKIRQMGYFVTKIAEVSRGRKVPQGNSLLSGMLLMIIVPVGIVVLALLHGVLISVVLRYFMDGEEVMAARGWVIPLSFLLALAEVALYEWQVARMVDLGPWITAATQDMLNIIPSLEQRDGMRLLSGKVVWSFCTSLQELNHLFALRSHEISFLRLTVAIQTMAWATEPFAVLLSDAEFDRLQRLDALLERYQRKQFGQVSNPLRFLKPGKRRRPVVWRKTKAREVKSQVFLRDLLGGLAEVQALSHDARNSPRYVPLRLNTLMESIDTFFFEEHNFQDALLFRWLYRKLAQLGCPSAQHSVVEQLSFIRAYLGEVLVWKEHQMSGQRVGSSGLKCKVETA